MSIRRNPIAYLALFIALGGSAYAAIRPPANSIGTVHLRNGAVTAAKVREHSLTSRTLAPRSVGSDQLAAGAVGVGQIRPHSLTSAVFAPGTLPTVSAPESLRTEVVSVGLGPPSCGSGGSCSVTSPVTVNLLCYAGQQVVGGGFDIPTAAQPYETVVASEPFTTPDDPNSAGWSGGNGTEGWSATITLTSSQPTTLVGTKVYAVCAAVG